MAQTISRNIMLKGIKDALILGNQVSPMMLKGLILTSILMGAVPVAMAWTSKQIIDGVNHSGNIQISPEWYLLAEAILAVIFLGANKLDALISIALRAKLGHCVREKIIEKVQGFSLSQMEDPNVCDLIVRTRKHSETRPLSILKKSSEIGHYLTTSFFAGIVLFHYVPLLLVAILLAAIPVLIADMKFNGDLFDILLWKSPANRMKLYIESILTSEASAKEVRVLGFARILMQRFHSLFYDQYQHEKKLTIRRSVWNIVLSTVGQLTLYLAFGWSLYQAMNGDMTIGQMTMLMLLLRQSQASIVLLMTALASLYDDSLYMSDLAELMHTQEDIPQSGVQQGCLPGDGIRLDKVSYQYPAGETFALQGISLHLKPGSRVAILGANGSGKSTLVKLLVGLYSPSEGRITLDGTPLSDWDRAALNRRISSLFQDYQSYHMITSLLAILVVCTIKRQSLIALSVPMPLTWLVD